MIQVNKGICPHDHICPLIKACPVGAIPQDSEGFPEIDFNLCIECGKCVRKCPMKAMDNRRRQSINRLKNCFNCYVTYFHSIQTMAWQAVVSYRHNSGNTLCNQLYSFIYSDVASRIGNNERCIMGGVFRTCQNISICSTAHFRNCWFDSH